MNITKIIKLIVLIIFLVIIGRYVYRYLKRGGSAILKLAPRFNSIFSLIKKAVGLAKQVVTKSVDVVDVSERSIKNMETKLSGSLVSPPTPPTRISTLAEAANIQPPPVATRPQIAADSSSDSLIQKGIQKGYCYIGTDRGFRSCISVKDSKSCMSGEIFPTKSVCENPSLRAGLPRNAGWYQFIDGKYQLNTWPYFNDHYYSKGESDKNEKNFNNFYDLEGAGEKNYNRKYNGTQTMSQYISQQDKNVKYGGRGESMPTAGNQQRSAPMLYSS